MTLTPLEQHITPRSGDDLITEAGDPAVFSLQPSGSAGELWCGVVVPSPPCSPFLKSITSKTEAIAYGQEKCRSAVDWRSGNFEGQAMKMGTLAKESPVLAGLSKASGGLSIQNLIRTSDSTLMSPLDRSSLSPPRRPNTTDVPVAHALSLPDIQHRPSSAPAWSSGDTPSSRHSTSLHVTPKQEPDMEISAPTRRSNIASMSGIMALGTRQTIASPNIMPASLRSYMPPIGSAQINGDYPPLATGPVPPSINYNMFGMVNIQTNSGAPRGGFPFFVPQPPASVPQTLPGRTSQTANTYVPGFPAFLPAPMNAGWVASSPMIPYSNVAYPNFQHHANQMQKSSFREGVKPS
ncbi:hypothetical protein F5887DRAFT_386533 [Amanita rubescens]|nr:hypothetical protein F5887DRAFT_386533 [Amanita rubescens]